MLTDSYLRDALALKATNDEAAAKWRFVFSLGRLRVCGDHRRSQGIGV
jgi:hypothetical protein